MQKIILILSVFLLVSAQQVFAANEDKFYIKATGGYSKFDKVHGFKSRDSSFLGLGVGMYVKDIFVLI